VLRDYSAEGERLSLPGLARTFTPRPHQRAAVARILSEPAVGLFHQVGADKTAEMICGAMELRRLGLIAKPGVVVPNHMLEQFSREWLQLYPQARVLAASSDDLAGDKRRPFVARAAANDWDAVILTRSAFGRLPVTSETEQQYERSQLVSLRAMLEKSKVERGLTVKRLEKQVARVEEQLKRLLDSKHSRPLTPPKQGLYRAAVRHSKVSAGNKRVFGVGSASIRLSPCTARSFPQGHWYTPLKGTRPRSR
jgi:N12 class adenine-specific DNA methylase